MLCLSYYLLCFVFNNIREEEGRTGSGRGGDDPNNVSKWKNDKIKNNKCAFKSVAE
jgi:hypothetical protein